jgi:histidinol dehydrogenase
MQRIQAERMKILRHTQPGFAKSLAALKRHAEPTDEVRKTVTAIIADIRKRGDVALTELTEKFGGPKLSPAELPVTERASVDAATRKAIANSHKNVFTFAKKSLRRSWNGRNSEGAQVGERFDPFQRIGIYVPGGTAPLVSTAIMTVTIAKAAGCPEIVAVTPCGKDGSVNPALLFALRSSGATEIYRVGGAQAVAALAYGTETIRPVQKIFGPGSPWVVEAKRQVFGQCAIDLLPGPSEILVLADATANAAWVAADLLAQAEHGHGSSILFITDSARLLTAVEKQIRAQAATLSRRVYLTEVLEQNAALVLVKSLADGVAIANDFAPEHISIVAKNEDAIARDIRTSGAIFLGGWSPVAAGDFVAGPSHTLPTGGAGKSFPGLMADMFQRRTSIVRLDRTSLAKSVETIEQFSRIEGLDAHGRSARIRFE